MVEQGAIAGEAGLVAASVGSVGFAGWAREALVFAEVGAGQAGDVAADFVGEDLRGIGATQAVEPGDAIAV